MAHKHTQHITAPHPNLLEKFLSVAVPPAPCKSGSRITSIYLCHSITSTSRKSSKLQKHEIFKYLSFLCHSKCAAVEAHKYIPYCPLVSMKGFMFLNCIPMKIKRWQSITTVPPTQFRTVCEAYWYCKHVKSNLSFCGHSPVDFYMFFYHPELLKKQRKVQSVGISKLAETTRLSISLLPFSEAGRQGHWRLKMGDWNRDSILTLSWAQTESLRNLFWWKCNHREPQDIIAILLDIKAAESTHSTTSHEVAMPRMIRWVANHSSWACLSAHRFGAVGDTEEPQTKPWNANEC